MDPDYYEAVIDVFIDLYEKGNIYRGMRMVNWDPVGKTALSDDEVIHKDVQSKLYYINYAIQGSNEFVHHCNGTARDHHGGLRRYV
jgi:valyl-tRNA synthetase